MKFSSFIVLLFVTISCVYAQSTDKDSPASKPSTTPAGAVKCYQCNSDNNGESDCDSSDKNILKKYIKTCPKLKEGTYAGKDASSCRKVLQDIADKSNVVRECAYSGDEPVDGKRRTGNKGIILYLYQCFNEGNEDPCNSSPNFKVSFFALLASFSLFVLAIKL
ncbi:hypothetical protein DdX_07283 [Ditylenchus destructor]|uniref:Protein sleepless n=1 Tax=Ditylenchus destructor TaxID=166010 RepID=A0AAD4N7B3_9BILA|nr:hypothetical protein DdX_07283 [Ditylenchus destructor]